MSFRLSLCHTVFNTVIFFFVIVNTEEINLDSAEVESIVNIPINTGVSSLESALLNSVKRHVQLILFSFQSFIQTTSNLAACSTGLPRKEGKKKKAEDLLKVFFLSPLAPRTSSFQN